MRSLFFTSSILHLSLPASFQTTFPLAFTFTLAHRVLADDRDTPVYPVEICTR
jgi:hypothetical protein